ncbi:MAG: DUF1592 domain-containing protein [Deltaproteobacteria bacterium]|nr:DUF1592 domain-containing protein [Deltaproteobacteria bacterium]
MKRPSARVFQLACLGLIFGSCTGAVTSRDMQSEDDGSGGTGGAGGDNSGGNLMPDHEEPRFACEQGAAPAVTSLHRLTRRQYTNTLADLSAWALGNRTEANAVLKDIDPTLSMLPLDVRAVTAEDPHGGYRRLDQNVQQAHAEGYYETGVALGRALTNGARLTKIAGACATDSDAGNDAACLQAFLNGFAARAVRGPLPSDVQSLLKKVFATGTGTDAWADVIAVLLNLPQFLYSVEHGDKQVAGKVYQLTDHELAARLSYHFTDTMPDDELWAAAKAGKLADKAELAAQVHRLASDTRFRGVMNDFFAEWLKVEDLQSLDRNASDPAFKSFAGNDLPKASLRQSMVDDVLGLASHYTFDEPGKVADLLTSRLSFAKASDLAAIYGVSPWNGQSPPPTLSEDRPGLLTRALFLSTGTATTRPIMKGVFIRKTLLCDSIPPPPANANANLPNLRAGMTTREVVEELTEKQGTTCAGCHASLINPLGFVTENFDSLGRKRTEEVSFDAAGKEVQRKHVNTQVVPRITDEDERSASGVNDVVQFMVESGKVQACLARNYTRFSLGRTEDTSQDGCLLERLRGKLAGGGSLADFAAEVALSPEFGQHAF